MGGTVHPFFDLHAVITLTNTHAHTQTVRNRQTCVPTPPDSVRGPLQRLAHEEQECYIFITDVINTECPMLFWEVLIAQQKRLIRSINQ